jgi:hypothetical protein
MRLPSPWHGSHQPGGTLKEKKWTYHLAVAAAG